MDNKFEVNEIRATQEAKELNINLRGDLNTIYSDVGNWDEFEGDLKYVPGRISGAYFDDSRLWGDAEK